MAKGFNIQDIEVTNKNQEKELPKILTGEVTIGLPADSPVKPNAEIEGEEVVKYPDGTVQTAKGPSHEGGGIKMALPPDTEIVSKTTLLTKSDVKYLQKNYNIELSTKDSYATAIDKYAKKIGLKKLNDEQADIISQLKKQMDKEGIDDKTKGINSDYLSNKIYDTEAKKAPLEVDRKKFFDAVFKLQEDKKPKPAQEETFKYGGVSGESFKAMCDKHGLTEAEGMALMGFEYGGKTDFQSLQENIGSGMTSLGSREDYMATIQKQTQAGIITPDQAQTLYSGLDLHFPEGTTSTKKATINEPWGGLQGAELDAAKKDWNNNEAEYKAYKKAELKFSDQTFRDKLFEQYQKDISNDANYKSKYASTYKKELQGLNKDQVINELLNFEKRNAKLAAFGYDAKNVKDQKAAPGANVNKTALDIINKNPDAFKDLDFSHGHIGQAAYIAYDNLVNGDRKTGKNYKMDLQGQKDETLHGGQVSSIDNVSTDTTLGQRLNVTDLPEVVSTPATKKIETIKSGPITDQVVVNKKPSYPQMFFHPDAMALPPNGQSPETAIQNRLQRIDPVKIGIENNLQAIDKSAQFATSQLDAAAPSQRLAALSTIIGATQDAENQAILGANTTNASNMINAEQFNIGQSDRENIAQGQNLLNFEQRSLTAQDKTQLDLRNYLNYNHNTAINNFANDSKLNLMKSLFPDYNVDFTGQNVYFDPSGNFNIKNNDEVNRIGATESGKTAVTESTDNTTK